MGGHGFGTEILFFVFGVLKVFIKYFKILLLLLLLF